MNFIGNILWLIFGGLFNAIAFALLGIFLCITIIGIPFGLQCFKLANLFLAPFGKDVDLHFDDHPIANVVWLILLGWELFVESVIIGALFCLTIIGIPFGKQWFKLAKLSLIPFGATIK